MARPNVIVIDDTAHSRNTLTAALSAIDVESSVAMHGQDGLDQMRRTAFDLILLNIAMPHKDGSDVLREVREDANLREIPILAISSLDCPEEIALPWELDAVDFLPKPFAHQIFKARVLAPISRERLRATTPHEISFRY